MTSTQAITIDIAGFVTRIHTDSQPFAERVRTRYEAFLGAADAAADMEVDVTLVPDALYVAPTPGPWLIETEITPERMTFLSYQEKGEVDLLARRGRIEMAPDAHLENYLRVIYAWLCVQNDSLLLHSAGVVRDGWGYVFFGPSGAGKTTTSRLASREGTVLSDDLVILRRDGAGYRLFGVPFKGELSEAPRANQTAPLRGIFRLRQGREHRLAAMPAMTATAEMVGAAPFVVREPQLAQQLITVCNQIARTVPVLNLHFRRDDGFWKVIDEHFAAVPQTAPTDGRPGY